MSDGVPEVSNLQKKNIYKPLSAYPFLSLLSVNMVLSIDAL